MEGRVVRISIAPVKALHVVNPDEVELTHAGVVGDRRFWLVDARPAARQRQGPSRAHAGPAGVGRGFAAARARVPRRLGRRGRGRAGRAGRGRRCTARRIRRGSFRGRGRRRSPEFAGEPLTLLWSEGGARRPRQRPRRLGVAHLARLARAAGRRRPARRSRSTAAASGCCSRSTASSAHEEDDVARQPRRDRRRGDRPARRRRPLRRDDERSRTRASPTSTRSSSSPATAGRA